MDALIAFLESLTIWHWWGLAGVLLVLELMTGTTYLLWPTAAALAAGAISVFPFGWQTEIIVFTAMTGFLTWQGDRYFPKLRQRTENPLLNERAEQLAGEKVVATVDFVAGRGRVKLGDSVWAAVLTGDGVVAKGAVLEIVSLDGATLRVRAV